MVATISLPFRATYLWTFIVADEDELKLLDASMKKNTALTRKLKQLSEETKQSILDDIARTNQSKVGLVHGSTLIKGT